MISGLFRFTLLNGMVCGDTFGKIIAATKLDIYGSVIERAYETLKTLNDSGENRDVMKTINLMLAEQRVFPFAAREYQYGEERQSVRYSNHSDMKIAKPISGQH